MELMRCYKYTFDEFRKTLSDYAEENKLKLCVTAQNQKIKLETQKDRKEIPFNEFAQYMVSMEIVDHILYMDENRNLYVYMFSQPIERV